MCNKKAVLVAVLSAGLLLAAALCAGAVIKQVSSAHPDKDGFYTKETYTAQAVGEISDAKIESMVKKLAKIKLDNLEGSRTFFALVPDKTFYLVDGPEKADYADIAQRLKDSLQGFEFVDLYSSLSLADYYKTDGHWRQEKIVPVSEVLIKAMGKEVQKQEYKENTKDGFVGAYRKHIQGDLPQETLCYLTSPAIDAAIPDSYQKPQLSLVYDTQALSGDTPYDVFLGGATPLVSIESPLSRSEAELIIFADSFASSLAPLLLGEYRNITIIDLRYMSSILLQDMVDFSGQDVLFIYSTILVKNNAILK